MDYYVAVFTRHTMLRDHLLRLAKDAFVNARWFDEPKRSVWTGAMVAVTDLPMAQELLRMKVRPRRRASIGVLVGTRFEFDHHGSVPQIADALGCSHVVRLDVPNEDWFIKSFRHAAMSGNNS